jgi:hypothetical protein
MELNRGGTAEEVIREGDPKDMIDIDDIVTLNWIARGPNLNYFELCPSRKRLMALGQPLRLAGLRAKSKREFKATTDSNHAHPIAENLLIQRFQAARPN